MDVRKSLLSFLLDKTVVQVCYSSNTVSLIFSEKGYLTLMGSFEINSEGESYYYDEIYPVTSDLSLLKLLEKKIVKVEQDEDCSGLHISFENNIELVLIKNQCYESYEISDGEERYIK